ncbi:MAG: hypothetical protein ACREU7_08090, partial [Burkholderiales bacterium]
MSEPRDVLHSWIAAEAAQPVGMAARALVEAIVSRHGQVVAAVLFYGACLRQPDPLPSDQPVFDFYALVDGYPAVYRGGVSALSNALLPPNVFYLEHPWQERILRAKYAIISLSQFNRGCSRRSFHSYFWARFAQPARIVYARDEAARRAVETALVEAVVTMAASVAPLLDGEIDASTLWIAGFQQTYRAELRSERSHRSALIHAADAARYERFTRPALAAAGLG